MLNNKQGLNCLQTCLSILLFEDAHILSVSCCATISPLGGNTIGICLQNSREKAVDDETTFIIGNSIKKSMFWQVESVRVRPHLCPAIPIFVRPSPSSSHRTTHIVRSVRPDPPDPPDLTGRTHRTHRTLPASVLFSSCTLVCSLSITGRPSTCYLHPPSVYISIPGPRS